MVAFQGWKNITLYILISKILFIYVSGTLQATLIQNQKN